MTELAFVVLGRPQPAGSKRAFQHPHTRQIVVTDDAKGSRSWKQEVSSAAMSTTPRVGVFTGPVEVELRFVMARPRSHMGTGRNAEQVKASAPAFPIVRPDVDKLSRAVLDALTGVVWNDDAQVVDKWVRKVYGFPERCEVRVRPLLASVGAVGVGRAA